MPSPRQLQNACFRMRLKRLSPLSLVLTLLQAAAHRRPSSLLLLRAAGLALRWLHPDSVDQVQHAPPQCTTSAARHSAASSLPRPANCSQFARSAPSLLSTLPKQMPAQRWLSRWPIASLPPVSAVRRPSERLFLWTFLVSNGASIVQPDYWQGLSLEFQFPPQATCCGALGL